MKASTAGRRGGEARAEKLRLLREAAEAGDWGARKRLADLAQRARANGAKGGRPKGG